MNDRAFNPVSGDRYTLLQLIDTGKGKPGMCLAEVDNFVRKGVLRAEGTTYVVR